MSSFLITCSGSKPFFAFSWSCRSSLIWFKSGLWPTPWWKPLNYIFLVYNLHSCNYSFKEWQHVLTLEHHRDVAALLRIIWTQGYNNAQTHTLTWASTSDPVFWQHDRMLRAHVMKRSHPEIVWGKAVNRKLSAVMDEEVSRLTSCYSALLVSPLRPPLGAQIAARKDEYKLTSCHKITHKNTHTAHLIAEQYKQATDTLSKDGGRGGWTLKMHQEPISIRLR